MDSKATRSGFEVTKTTEFFAYPQWQPLAAVGSHGPEDALGMQICISIMGSSIVPEKPRVAIALWKQNYTHDLVAASASLCVSLLTAEQLDAFETLGLRSGRTEPKLGGLRLGTTTAGNPYLLGCAGYADCLVSDSLDLGDCTLFVANVVEEHSGVAEPVTWAAARERLPEAVLARYEEKFAHDADLARRTMRLGSLAATNE